MTSFIDLVYLLDAWETNAHVPLKSLSGYTLPSVCRPCNGSIPFCTECVAVHNTPNIATCGKI